MTEPFDLIFVDLEFSAYCPTVRQILDRGLLAKDGIILVDNGIVPKASSTVQSRLHWLILTIYCAVFARGFAVDVKNTSNIDPANIDHWIQAGRLVDEFNSFVANDPRLNVTVFPFFDGVSEISLKQL